MTHTLAIFGSLGGWEIGLIAIIGLLIFGGRLPDVARNMGKGIVEFKKGLKGIEDDIEDASSKPSIDAEKSSSVNAEAKDHASSEHSA